MAGLSGIKWDQWSGSIDGFMGMVKITTFQICKCFLEDLYEMIDNLASKLTQQDGRIFWKKKKAVSYGTMLHTGKPTAQTFLQFQKLELASRVLTMQEG